MTPPSDAVLARYVASECTAEEIREVERWSELDAANRARLQDFRALWEAVDPSPSWDLEGRWTGLQHRIRADSQANPAADRRREPSFGRLTPASRPRRMFTAALTAAAVLLLTAGVTLAVLRRSPASAPTLAAVPMREYVTPRGQRGTLQLPDGSRLVLAPETRLRIPADFGRRTREVVLEGEALFDVVHDGSRPFRVHANHAVAEDIGTRFDVRAYPGDSVVAVAVEEGAVALGSAVGGVGAAAEGVVLRAGELGTLASDGRMATARDAEALSRHLSWVDGKLRFVETPLSDVLQSVNRWYDLDIRVDDRALAARPITAEFSVQSAPQMLRALAIAVDAQITQSGRVVTLTQRVAR